MNLDAEVEFFCLTYYCCRVQLRIINQLFYASFLDESHQSAISHGVFARRQRFIDSRNLRASPQIELVKMFATPIPALAAPENWYY